MLFPPSPTKGNEVFKWAQRIHEYIKSIRPLSSDSVKVKQTPAGTTFSSKYIDGDRWPFQVYQDPDYTPSGTEANIRIRGGYFERTATETGDGIRSTIDDGYYTGAGGADFTDDTDDAIGKPGYEIYDGDIIYVVLVLWNNAGAYQDYDNITPDQLKVEYWYSSRPPWPDTSDAYNVFKVLAKVENVGGWLEIDHLWRGGEIKDFHLVPDGHPNYDSVFPKLGSLGYQDEPYDATTTPFERIGTLQDWNSWRDIIHRDNITNYENDYAISYFDYAGLSGFTEKKYARIDSHKWDDWTYHAANRSLEVKSVSSSAIWGDERRFQAYDFDVYGATPDFTYSDITSFTGPTVSSGEDTGEYLVMCRRRNPISPDGFHIVYADFSAIGTNDDIDEDFVHDYIEEFCRHNQLDTSWVEDRRDDYKSLDDHDKRHATLGGVWDDSIDGEGWAGFQSIGYWNAIHGSTATPDKRIDLELGRLFYGNDYDYEWSLDWLDCHLNDLSTYKSIDWNLRRLYDTDGTNVVGRWDEGRLFSDLENPATDSVDWKNRRLYPYGAGGYVVDWDGGTLHEKNSGSWYQVLDWFNGYLYDPYDGSSVMYFNGSGGGGRYFYGSSLDMEPYMDFVGATRYIAMNGTQVLTDQQTMTYSPPTVTGAARDGELRQFVLDLYTQLQNHGMVT